MAKVKLSQQTVREFRRARRKISMLAGNLDKATPEAIRVIGEDIMTDIKSSTPGKGVPVKEGVLRSSGRVDAAPYAKGVVLSFGGASAPYALVQHENLQFHHTVGEPRYLVRGVERWEPNGVSAQKARARLQREIDKLSVAKGGGGLKRDRGGRLRDARGRFV